MIFAALTQSDRDGTRPWLFTGLVDDEHPPSVLRSHKPDLVVWSSLWPDRPDVNVRFDIQPHAGGPRPGTDLRWTLLVHPPEPDPAMVAHLRKRMNQLINTHLRYSFGQ